jgi:hypothetical protein
MLALGVLYLIIGGSSPALTVRDTTFRGTATSRVVLAPVDTPKKQRPKAIEVSDAYATRLKVHQYVAYATIPVFALQWVAGNQLFQASRNAPEWAKFGHRAGATALAGMFTVNTVTGVWNWWDSRSAPQNRMLRTIHAISMLTADGMFTYAGLKLSNDAETSEHARIRHRQVALQAMGVTIASSLMMKIWNR